MSSTYLYSDNDTTYDMSVSSTGTVLSYTDITTRVPLPSIQANANKYLKVRNDGKNLEWDDVVLSGGIDLILDERTASNPPSILFEDAGGTQYNTGINMYRDTTNANNQTISFYANNTKKLDIAENRIISKEEILGVNGTASVPSYSFESDTNTGIYRPNSFQVGIACNGGITANFTTTTVDFGSAGNSREVNVTGSLNATGWCRTGNGTAGLPVYTFTADPDCGMYRVATNQVGISAGGVLSANFTSTGVEIPGSLTSVSTNIGTGTYSWNNLGSDAYNADTQNGNISFGLSSTGTGSIGRRTTFLKSNTNNSIVFTSSGNVRLTTNSGTQTQNNGTFTNVPTNSGRTWLFQIVRTGAADYQLTSLSMGDATNSYQQFDLVNANIFRAGDGSQSIPSFSFATPSGNDTGMYYDGSSGDRINFTCNNFLTWSFRDNFRTTSYRPLDFSHSSSAGAPLIMMGSDTTTGIYKPGTNQIAISTNSVLNTNFTATGVDIGTAGTNRNLTVNGNIYNSLGTNSSPTYSFIGDTDTGMYSTAGDVINFATNATQRMRIDNTGVSITAPFKPSDLIQYSVSTLLTGNFNTNTLSSHFIRVDSGGGNIVMTLGAVGAGSHFTIFKETANNDLQVTNVGSDTYNGSTRSAFAIISGVRGIINLYQVSATNWFGFVNTF
jgi:hypothetical protein